MCCDAREPLAGCTQSEAESNQSLRMMLLRAAAGSATKFGREHSEQGTKVAALELGRARVTRRSLPFRTVLGRTRAPHSLLRQLVLWTST